MPEAKAASAGVKPGRSPGAWTGLLIGAVPMVMAACASALPWVMLSPGPIHTGEAPGLSDFQRGWGWVSLTAAVASLACYVAGMLLEEKWFSLLRHSGCLRAPGRVIQQNKTVGVDKLGKVKVGDIEIAYREYGAGFPLVKIVGFASTMDGGDPELVAALAERFRVITFDNRGMGETSAGTRPFTVEQFAEDTTGLMDALGIERAHVFGISMGGFIAQELALRHPEKVEKLVLMASSCGGIDSIPISPEVIEQLGDFSGTTEERLVRMATLLFPQDWLSGHEAEAREKLTLAPRLPSIESVGKQAAAMRSWQGACDRLDELKAPTLVIAGTEDQVIDPWNSLLTANKLPGGKLSMLEGAGHGLTFQCPLDCAGPMIDFLE